MRDTKLIICDWSGVLSDDRKPVYASNMVMCQRFGIKPLTYEEWLPTTGANAGEWFAVRGVKLEPDQLADVYEAAFAEVHAQGVRPIRYPGAELFLQRATNGRSAIVVSTHPQYFLQQEAEGYGIAPFFRYLYGNSKNKTSTIRDALLLFGIVPEDCVMIGDTISDMRYAQAAGVRRIGITTGYHSRDRLQAENPDLIVDSLTELAEYF